MSFGTRPPVPKDWSKFVTMTPVPNFSFRIHEDDPRPYAVLTLINKGEHPILFKIKTTKPARYLVRPSQGIIGVRNEEAVRIIFTKQLDSEVRALPPGA